MQLAQQMVSETGIGSETSRMPSCERLWNASTIWTRRTRCWTTLRTSSQLARWIGELVEPSGESKAPSPVAWASPLGA